MEHRDIQVNVIGNEDIWTPFLGRVSVSVDEEKLARRLNGKVSPSWGRDKVTVSMGKRNVRQRIVDEIVEDMRNEGKPEVLVQGGKLATDIASRGLSLLLHGGTRVASFYAPEDEDCLEIEVDVPKLSMLAISKEGLQRSLAKRFQHEEEHLTITPSQYHGGIDGNEKRMLLRAGVYLAGLTATALGGMAEIDPRITIAASSAILIGGSAISDRMYRNTPHEREAREAAREIDPEVMDIFKIEQL
jgi:hypothetical protein